MSELQDDRTNETRTVRYTVLANNIIKFGDRSAILHRSRPARKVNVVFLRMHWDTLGTILALSTLLLLKEFNRQDCKVNSELLS